MVDVKCLSDSELWNELNKLGFSPGPILSSTRKLYENKLIELLVSPPCASPVMNGPAKQGRAQNHIFKIQEHQEEFVKSNSDYNDKMIIKGLISTRNLERFPASLRLAVFGIFLIVIFVYITVEKKPFFS
ncbi:LOW QUALITY PROTEIN: LEM domain-containing protein 1 [Rhynchonycteris naso]